jgi:transcriptional regulator with XRE-family HTH domain
MTGTAALVRGVKARLRAQGLTYRQLAEKLALSEPTVKRDLARGNFSLRRLDRICEVLGVSVEDLLASPGTSPLTELTEQQEHALVSSPRLLVVTYLVVNDWKFADITATFRLDANELIDVLLKLDRLRILEFRPPNRVRRLTARNFTWRKDGPVQAYFLARVIPEFFDARFESLGDEMRFVGGTLSAASMLRMQSSLRRVAAEFEQLAHQDSRLPLEERDGCSAILAFRRWEFSEFVKLRRAARPRRTPGR